MSSCQVNGSPGPCSNHVGTPNPSPSNGLGESLCRSPEAGVGPAGAKECDNNQPSVAEHSPEVLGSVVQNHELENGDKNSYIQLRTSARVSKKMRLDFIASQTPPDKKDVPKEEDKIDIKPKRRPFELWPQEDKNTFFEALNEYGKDFDAIQRYFEVKAKRKNLPDHTVKNKEQIRHFYYRTWHKISKHLRFPDEVKKATQEMYGLINYGELRKKIGGTVSEKTSLRLNELIYRGFTQIRIRGKTIRIKTPICRALRKLNQQEELAEDLKLPARVTVELRPRSNEAWARVQAIAQNPRVQTLLPLQRRLSSLLIFLQQRWQSNHVKHCERLQYQLNEVSANIETSTPPEAGASSTSFSNDDKTEKHDPGSVLESKNELNSSSTTFRCGSHQMLRIAPKSGVAISPVTINLSEYFTSTRLSLKSHEGRLGNHAAEELFNSMLLAGSKSCGKRGAKRVRHDSGSEKKKEQLTQVQPQHTLMSIDSSPEKSKDGTSVPSVVTDNNEDVKPSCPFRLFGSGVCLNPSSSSVESGNGELKINEDTGVLESSNHIREEIDISSNKIIPANNSLHPGPCDSKTINQNLGRTSSESNEEVIRRVRAGWTLDNAKAVTIGELYLMFGADSKLQLEYWWEDITEVKETNGAQESNSPAHVLSESSSPEPASSVSAQPLALTLQKLLALAKMYTTNSKTVQCPCGHVCSGTPKSGGPKQKVSRPVRANADSDKALKSEPSMEKTNSTNSSPKVAPISVTDGPFRRPIMPSPQFKPPPRPGTADAFKAQLEKFRPRFCNRRGRPVSVRKNVVVPRMLPLLPKAPPASSLLTLQVIPQRGQMTGEFVPIAQCPSVLNYTQVPSSSTQTAGRQMIPRKVVDSSSSISSLNSQPNSSSTSDCPNSVGTMSLPDLCQGALLPSKSDQTSPPMSSASEDKSFGQSQSSRLVQDPFPPTLDTPVNSPPSISHLLDMSLPSELNLNSNALLEPNFSGLLSSSTGVSASPPPASPSSILKEDENQWLNAEVSDFSLSSFLGHLESPLKSSTSHAESDEQHSMTSDVEAQMQCLMAENSLDYMTKFADLAAQIASDGANKS